MILPGALRSTGRVGSIQSLPPNTRIIGKNYLIVYLHDIRNLLTMREKCWLANSVHAKVT
jgi:hypothetical protein